MKNQPLVKRTSMSLSSKFGHFGHCGHWWGGHSCLPVHTAATGGADILVCPCTLRPLVGRTFLSARAHCGHRSRSHTIAKIGRIGNSHIYRICHSGHTPSTGITRSIHATA
ncbi:MAG: hypothetical protein OJF49_004480 [Ktedonobacterales bacterium]|nr:MAG: hypothetical protein OJF49_004480 [Ktedonobacterales bacterium]